MARGSVSEHCGRSKRALVPTAVFPLRSPLLLQEVKKFFPNVNYGTREALASSLSSSRAQEEVDQAVQRAQYSDEVSGTAVQWVYSNDHVDGAVQRYSFSGGRCLGQVSQVEPLKEYNDKVSGTAVQRCCDGKMAEQQVYRVTWRVGGGGPCGAAHG